MIIKVSCVLCLVVNENPDEIAISYEYEYNCHMWYFTNYSTNIQLLTSCHQANKLTFIIKLYCFMLRAQTQSPFSVNV